MMTHRRALPVVVLMILIASSAYASARQDDPRTLVERLSSAKMVDRDAASASLEALEEDAIEVLTDAANSSDLELRARAAKLLDRIEGRIFSRPQRVTLDFSQASPRDAFAEVTRQTGYTISLDPATSPRWREASISVQGSMTFWEALDKLRLPLDLSLQTTPGRWERRPNAMPGVGRGREFSNVAEILLREDGSPQPPTSLSGAFRCTLVALSLHRSREFQRVPGEENLSDPVDLFTAQIQFRSEPSLSIASLEDPQITEGIDDRQNSLLLASQDIDPARPAPATAVAYTSRNEPMMLALRYPADPGDRIVRLAGHVRAIVVGNLGTPILMDLRTTGKAQGAPITIHEVRPIPNSSGVMVQIEVDPPNPANRPLGSGRLVEGPTAFRPPPSARGQLTFFDAAGKVCQRVDLGQTALGNPGITRTSLAIQSPDGIGPPVSARFQPSSWATIQIPFVFHDLPMP